jgi:hypothetical protein
LLRIENLNNKGHALGKDSLPLLANDYQKGLSCCHWIHEVINGVWKLL